MLYFCIFFHNTPNRAEVNFRIYKYVKKSTFDVSNKDIVICRNPCYAHSVCVVLVFLTNYSHSCNKTNVF